MQIENLAKGREPNQKEMLGSKTLGTKCIKTLLCIILAKHDQNLEFRFRLLKMIYV